MKKKQLSPGSDEARAAGCICPVMDNQYGKGYEGMPGIFVRSGACPVHDKTVSKSMAKRLKVQHEHP